MVRSIKHSRLQGGVMGCKGKFVQDGRMCMGCPDCDYVAKVADKQKASIEQLQDQLDEAREKRRERGAAATRLEQELKDQTLRYVEVREEAIAISREKRLAEADLESVWHKANDMLNSDAGMDAYTPEDAMEHIINYVRNENEERTERLAVVARAAVSYLQARREQNDVQQDASFDALCEGVHALESGDMK